MFLIIKKLNMGLEIESFQLYDEYNERDLAQAQEKYDNVMKHKYGYGSTENAKKNAKEIKNSYLNDCAKETYLFVNGKIILKNQDAKQAYKDIIEGYRQRYSTLCI